MIAILTLLAATLVVAVSLLVFLLKRQRDLLRRAEAEQRMLETILWDVACGEADVWIDEGVLKAARKAVGEVQIH